MIAVAQKIVAARAVAPGESFDNCKWHDLRASGSCLEASCETIQRSRYFGQIGGQSSRPCRRRFVIQELLHTVEELSKNDWSLQVLRLHFTSTDAGCASFAGIQTLRWCGWDARDFFGR